MNCTEFELAFERAVERREPLEPALLTHVHTCSECRNFWEMHQQLDAAIAAWRVAEPSSGFADSVLATLAHSGPLDEFDDVDLFEYLGELAVDRRVVPAEPRQFGTIPVGIRSGSNRLAITGRSSVFAIASVAACLIITAAFAFQWSGRASIDSLARRESPIRQSRFALKTPQDWGSPWRFSGDRENTASVGNPLDFSGALSAVISDLKSEYREIASETKSVAREMVHAIPYSMAVPAMPEGDEIPFRPNTSDVVRIWRPIGDQVESALGFLWQALPTEIPSG